MHSPKCLFSSVCEAADFRRISIFTKTPPNCGSWVVGRGSWVVGRRSWVVVFAVTTAAAAANGAGSSRDHAANGAGSSSEAADAAAFFEPVGFRRARTKKQVQAAHGAQGTQDNTGGRIAGSLRPRNQFSTSVTQAGVGSLYRRSA